MVRAAAVMIDRSKNEIRQAGNEAWYRLCEVLRCVYRCSTYPVVSLNIECCLYDTKLCNSSTQKSCTPSSWRLICMVPSCVCASPTTTFPPTNPITTIDAKTSTPFSPPPPRPFSLSVSLSLCVFLSLILSLSVSLSGSLSGSLSVSLCPLSLALWLSFCVSRRWCSLLYSTWSSLAMARPRVAVGLDPGLLLAPSQR